MDKKILVISIFAAVLIALLPISSVVGVDVVKSNAEKGSVASPLFAFRQHVANEKDTKKINTNYIGKGRVFDVFPIIKSSLNKLMDRAVKLINVRPELLTKIQLNAKETGLNKMTNENSTAICPLTTLICSSQPSS